MKKALPKILKTMKPEDRVMIIGVTKSPFGEKVLAIHSPPYKIMVKGLVKGIFVHGAIGSHFEL